MRLKELGEKVDHEDDGSDEDGEELEDEELAALNGDKEVVSKEQDIVDSNEQKLEQSQSPRSQSPRGELELNIDSSIE